MSDFRPNRVHFCGNILYYFFSFEGKELLPANKVTHLCIFGEKRLSTKLVHPHLQSLDLSRAETVKDDLQCLSTMTYENKLPRLQVLNLSNNGLFGCLSSFLPDPHPGLLQLEKLHLAATALSLEDIQHLRHLVEMQKLPALKELDISGNGLNEMQVDVAELIYVCVSNHQRELVVKMSDNNLSAWFRKMLDDQCAGSLIMLEYY